MIGCLRTCVRKQPIIALYFKFDNLKAWASAHPDRLPCPHEECLCWVHSELWTDNVDAQADLSLWVALSLLVLSSHSSYFYFIQFYFFLNLLKYLWWYKLFLFPKVEALHFIIISEYDQKIPQSLAADNPMALRERATQPSWDTRKTN